MIRFPARAACPTRRRYSNQQGSSILTAMILVILVEGLIVATCRIIENYRWTTNLSGNVAGRNSISINIQRVLRTNETYYNSIIMPVLDSNNNMLSPDNSMLLFCLTDDSRVAPDSISGKTGDCLMPPSSSAAWDVTLYGTGVLADNSVTSTPVPIIGTLRNPVYYDTYGRICEPQRASCAMKVYGNFVPSCPGGTPSCSIAASIVVTATIASASKAIPFAPIVINQTVPVFSPNSNPSNLSDLNATLTPPLTTASIVTPGGYQPAYAAPPLPAPTPEPGLPQPPPPPPNPGMFIQPCGSGMSAHWGGCRGIHL